MKYDNPFPGMNPYLERRDIWPDFHDRLIASLANELGPQLPDNYRIALHRRVEVQEPLGSALGLNLMVPDALVTREPTVTPAGPTATAEAATAVAAPAEEAGAVRVRMPRDIRVAWLRVETVPDRELVTIVEVLSPTNKAPGRERLRYVRKREVIVASGANLVEIGLLRRWEPMPLEAPPTANDYRVLVCRGWERPDALLFPFSVKQAIPKFALPLLPEDEVGPEVELGPIINAMHHTARYSQVARYGEAPPEPEFPPEAAEWVKERVVGFLPTG